MPPSFQEWTSTTTAATVTATAAEATAVNSAPVKHPANQMQEQGEEDRELECEEEVEERARCEWEFRLCASMSPSSTAGEAPDILGAVEFDPSDQLLATGGIARKIRIYTLGSLLDADVGGGIGGGGGECSYYMCTPAKLSSLRWKPGSSSRVIGSGDYDGVVTEYDLERGVAVSERDEHGGRRVWSVDYSRFLPQLCASGSDDGTAQIWDTRCYGMANGTNGHSTSHSSPAAASIVLNSPVCSVEFDQQGAPLLGLACADTNAYVHDLRMLSRPLAVLRGHQRTVTYVRLLGGGARALTASTDGSVRLWDPLAQESSQLRTYRGHLNSRSFVGLSVWTAGGLVGCGSESNEVYVYDLRWGEPIWVHGFGEGKGRFVSCVAWRQREEDVSCGGSGVLVAGGSDGSLKVFVGERRPAACM